MHLTSRMCDPHRCIGKRLYSAGLPKEYAISFSRQLIDCGGHSGFALSGPSPNHGNHSTSN